MRLAPFVVFFAACSDPVTGTDDTGTVVLEFCDAITDGGQSSVEAVGGSAASGDLVMTVITNESVDVHDPMYVAFKEYTLENVALGGVATTGTTTGDGLAPVSNLGAGEWTFEATYSRGSSLCSALITLDVVANSTTTGCVVMTCPD